MKQILVGGNVDYPTTPTNGYDLTSLTKGAIAAFKLNDTVDLIDGTAPIDKNFQLVLGRGSNVAPFIIPEIDVKSLSVVKSTYSAGNPFSAAFVCPGHTTAVDTPTSYTFVLIKRGTVFNERNKWTFDVTVAPKKTMTAKDMCKNFYNIIDAEIENIGLTNVYKNDDGTLTITSATNDFDIQFVNSLNISLTEISGTTSISAGKIKHYSPAINDKAYVKDLVQRCVAGKGIKYLGEDGKEIYPGYPESVDADSYVIYTLRFAVPRVAAKQRDEVVYQTVHLAIPTAKTAVIGKWDIMFGLASPVASTSVEDEE